jgi:hypothetical protein
LSQVPVIGSGAWHLITVGPTFTSQQIWPAVQHAPPQQKSVPEQVAPLHGGMPQVPLLQKGCAPGHWLPQVPQLRMSFWWFTHRSPQHESPAPHVAAVQAPVVLVPVLVVAPPPPDVLTFPPQETTTIVPIPTTKKLRIVG